jgi:hypothetical protein
MIDQCSLFGGPDWEFYDAMGTGLYARRMVYGAVMGLNSFEPWLERIENFPNVELFRARTNIPPV